MDQLNNTAFDYNDDGKGVADDGQGRTATLQGNQPEGLNMNDLSGIMSSIKQPDGMTERPTDSLASLQDFMSNAKFGQKAEGQDGRMGGAPVIPGLNLGARLGDEQSGSKVITP